MSVNTQHFTAYTLLEMYLQLRYYKPLDKDSVFTQQFMAVLRAFNINSTLTEFGEGGFLLERPPMTYPLLRADMEAMAKKQGWKLDGPGMDQLGNIKPSYMQYTYTHFMDFLVLIRKMINFSNNYLCGPLIPVHYFIRTTDEFLDERNQKILKITSLVASIIDPSDRSFTREEMIQQYGFPDEDVNWDFEEYI